MEIICPICGDILKLADSQPNPEERGFQDNFYNGVFYDSTYIPSRDRNHIVDQYLEKYKKTYPKKHNVPDGLEDDIGISTERNDTQDQEKIAGYANRYYCYYCCANCNHSFVSDVRQIKKLSYQPDPSNLNYDKLDETMEKGTSPVDTQFPSPYSDRDDSDRCQIGGKGKDNDSKKKFKLTKKPSSYSIK